MGCPTKHTQCLENIFKKDIPSVAVFRYIKAIDYTWIRKSCKLEEASAVICSLSQRHSIYRDITATVKLPAYVPFKKWLEGCDFFDTLSTEKNNWTPLPYHSEVEKINKSTHKLTPGSLLCTSLSRFVELYAVYIKSFLQ